MEKEFSFEKLMQLHDEYIKYCDEFMEHLIVLMHENPEAYNKIAEEMKLAEEEYKRKYPPVERIIKKDIRLR